MDQKENPLVSIIVPVYNAEKFLEKCIESILRQTYRNFELILVDDGSSDESGRICDVYALRDLRIKVIHTDNSGVSHARNTGIDIATGEFVIFIDSDDWVSEEYIESLIPTDGEDLITGGYSCVTGNVSSVIMKHQPHTVDSKQWRDDFKFWWFQGMLTRPWGNCYRRSVIQINNIRFNEQFSFAEDELFNLTFIFYSKLVRYIDACNYNYRSDISTSLIHRYHPNRTESAVAVVQAMERISGKEEHILRWREWKSVIVHHRKYKASSAKAKACLIDSYYLKYFRESLPYVRKYGSLDEKIETFFMYYWVHSLFPYVYRLIEKISHIRRKKKN